MPERQLAQLIRLVVDHNDKTKFSLTIDGEEFPFYILEDAIEVVVAPDAMPGIRVTLMADRVEVVNDFADAVKAAAS